MTDTERAEKKSAKKANRLADKIKNKADRIKIKHQWKTLPKALRPKQYSSNHLHRWNAHEELANSITHGIGALLGIAALVLLVTTAALHGGPTEVVAGAILGVSIILTYASSTIYHLVLYPPVKQFFRIMDHCSIFILIAGSYTPFALVTLHGPVGWSLFGLVWGITAVGIYIKVLYVDRFETLSTILYLAMGWLAVALSSQILQHLAFGGIMWLVIGGLCYTVGVAFFVLEKIPFFHTIWHLFVLAGTICHFFSIIFYVMPVVIK